MEKSQNINNKQGLNETLVQLKCIFENAIHAIIVINPDGVILYWNPKARVIFDWTEEETFGKKIHEIIIPEAGRNEHLSWMEQFNEGKVVNNTHEISALRKNNTDVNIALGISLSTINGERFYICYISDLTDRKLISSRLDKQKEFYENILNKIPTDIAVFDKEHRYLFVNPGAIKDEELRKYIIGKDDFEYAAYRKRDTSLAQVRREQFLEVKKSGREMRWEDSLKSPEGNTITHLRRLFPVLDEKGELSMVIGFGIDITERKLLEEKQALYVEQLSLQNVQLVDFCNIVSHNLRAPLVNMSMLVTFIEESTDEQERKFLISKFKPVIENLHTTFNELVESIQIKQDIEIQSENINLEMCLNRTLEPFEAEISRSGAVIERKFNEAPEILFPPKYLFSIFHNLISNSLKYKSPQRKPHIIIETKKANNNIILSVSDNGLGIDLVKHKDNFFKIGKVFHRNPNAKGFGLYMTKTHVDAMDGKIWAESTPDKGTTIFIEFKNQY
ncbi:MAG: PAS domain-containing sensor histidine kinase [Bacteroidota bacterium]|nr:PAS domain-containing sensor histidine kinase [Bacteroidota bacterium]